MRRAVSAAAVAVGLAGVVAGGVGLVAPGSAAVPDAGSVPAAAAAGHRAVRLAARPRARSDRARAASTAPWSAPPDRLDIAALDLRAPVVPVPVGRDGGVRVPSDVRIVGWVATSGRLGERRGTAALVGHLDDTAGRLGVLERLARIRVGTHVVVHAAGGGATTYVVQAVRSYPKAALPRDTFTPRGHPRLALITCTGPYDADAGGHPGNLVVWAVPASPVAR